MKSVGRGMRVVSYSTCFSFPPSHTRSCLLFIFYLFLFDTGTCPSLWSLFSLSPFLNTTGSRTQATFSPSIFLQLSQVVLDNPFQYGLPGHMHSTAVSPFHSDFQCCISNPNYFNHTFHVFHGNMHSHIETPSLPFSVGCSSEDHKFLSCPSAWPPPSRLVPHLDVYLPLTLNLEVRLPSYTGRSTTSSVLNGVAECSLVVVTSRNRTSAVLNLLL